MQSSLLDNTYGQMTLGMACHHRFWTAHTVRKSWSWHAIIAVVKHTRSETVKCYISSSPLDNMHRVGRRRAWHAIITFGQHKLSNNVGRDMTSPLLDSTHVPTMSGAACHHNPWTANTVERRQAWHAITSVRQHTRSDDIGRGMTTPPMETHKVKRYWV